MRSWIGVSEGEGPDELVSKRDPQCPETTVPRCLFSNFFLSENMIRRPTFIRSRSLFFVRSRLIDHPKLDDDVPFKHALL